jgi:tRNA(Leu) C34 or U34 (ribose-2'-O)-methylase TrmL
VPRHRSAAVTPAAVKASAGAIELLPVAQVTNTVAFLKQAKDTGFWVYGAAGEARASYLQLDLTGRVALVFGAEGRGLRPLVARTCDALAAVPIAPQVDSLNVSVAAALFLFEARRQTSLRPAPAAGRGPRRGDPGPPPGPGAARAAASGSAARPARPAGGTRPKAARTRPRPRRHGTGGGKGGGRSS